MLYPEPLIPARFLRREKRYSILVRLEDGEEAWAHSPNPGRLLSCLPEVGTPVFLSRVQKRPDGGPKYRFRVEQSEPIPGVRVGINPLLANRVAAEVLESGMFPELSGCSLIGKEVPYGEGSRVDILGEMGRQRVYIEVKSVTYREKESGLFPDAVSERALRHLQELERCVALGHRSVLLFVVQRVDVARVLPADGIDPEYGRAFRSAIASGVLPLAVRVRPGDEGLFPERPIDVAFPFEHSLSASSPEKGRRRSKRGVKPSPTDH
jgi:sugar fermentation stimulation protein A